MPFEFVPCNLCGATDYDTVHDGNLTDREAEDQRYYACTTTAFARSGPIVRCRRCGLVYLNPRPTQGHVLGAYANVVDEQYIEERPAQMRTFDAELRALERHTPARSRLVDVGAHAGTFLEAALARGWTDALGVEPSRWAAEQARQRGLNVESTTLRDAQFPDQSFEVVTLWDVIEHFGDPAAEVREFHRVLRPGGILALCTMNVDCLLARVLGRRWPFYIESHLYYFSPSTLSRMLSSAGFRTLEVRPHRRATRIVSFVARMKGWFPLAGRVLDLAVRKAGWQDRIVTIDFHDVFTLIARKD